MQVKIKTVELAASYVCEFVTHTFKGDINWKSLEEDISIVSLPSCAVERSIVHRQFNAL